MFCPQCGDDVFEAKNFCTSCGTALNAEAKAQRSRARHSQEANSSRPTSAIRQYKSPKAAFNGVLNDFERWLRSRNYQTQRLTTENGKTLIQAQKPGEWRSLLGMANAVNVLFHQEDTVLDVEVGGGKWVDKAVWGLVALATPFSVFYAIPAAFGVWDQWRLPDQVFEYLSDRIGG